MAEETGAGGEARHPIRVVARRTGISLHVLRAWERRYRVVEPRRSEGGQRLYSDADVARLVLLREAVEGGRAISQVAELPDAELAVLVSQDRSAGPGASPADGSGRGAAAGAGMPGHYLAGCLEAAERLDYDAVHRLLLRGVVSLLPRDFIEGVVGPLLHEVGERWHRGELKPAHEHAVSVAVGRVLGFLLSAYEPEAGAPVLVSSTVAGESHEFGAQLASVVAAEAGWRVLYLGSSLPAEEIARAAHAARAAAVALSVVNEAREDVLVAQLGAVREQVRADVRVLVGGRGAAAHAGALRRLGVEYVALSELAGELPRFFAAGAPR